MTVKQLIDKLKEYNPDTRVVTYEVTNKYSNQYIDMVDNIELELYPMENEDNILLLVGIDI